LLLSRDRWVYQEDFPFLVIIVVAYPLVLLEDGLALTSLLAV
jgi:hypothetical protein